MSTPKSISTELLEEVLRELSRKRDLFWSEADFQFSFAWLLKEHLGEEAEILLERRYEATLDCIIDGVKKTKEEKFYIDIVVKYDGKFYPIELKYKTKAVKSGEIVTVTQSANDLGRYFYLWDIFRLEKLRDQQDDFGEGYAIMLTNDPNYYCEPKYEASKESVDHNFRLHPRTTDIDIFPIPGKVHWDLSHLKNDTKKDSWTKNHPDFELASECNLKWMPYNKDNELGLKYLINTVLSSNTKRNR